MGEQWQGACDGECESLIETLREKLREADKIIGWAESIAFGLREVPDEYQNWRCEAKEWHDSLPDECVAPAPTEEA